jgi:hypothetical protein
MPGDTEENDNISIRVAGNLAEIKTWYLLSTRLEHCSYARLLSNTWCNTLYLQQIDCRLFAKKLWVLINGVMYIKVGKHPICNKNVFE